MNQKGAAVPFEERKLDLLAGDQLKPDYLALNPNGVVPTLDHDGTIVIDSSVIIEYLDEVAPEPRRARAAGSPRHGSCAAELAPKPGDHPRGTFTSEIARRNRAQRQLRCIG
jgi:glutathione S-transferase